MPPRDAVFGSRSAHEEFLEAGGYKPGAEVGSQAAQYTGGGFEWTDVRNPRNLLRTRIAVELAAKGFVSSLHQSWRSTTAPEIAARLLHPSGEWNGVPNTPKNVALSLGLVATIPFIDSWTRRLMPIQQAAGRKLPVVAYPNEQQPPNAPPRFDFDYPGLSKHFAVLRHQPTAETLQAWGVLSVDTTRMVKDMLEVQSLYGFAQVAGDTKHTDDVRLGFRFRDPVEMFRLLAKANALAEIHLNLTGDPDALRQTIDGNLIETRHGEMLAVAMGAASANSAITIVPEVTASDFSAIGYKDIAGGNKQVVEAILGVAQGPHS